MQNLSGWSFFLFFLFFSIQCVQSNELSVCKPTSCCSRSSSKVEFLRLTVPLCRLPATLISVWVLWEHAIAESWKTTLGQRGQRERGRGRKNSNTPIRVAFRFALKLDWWPVASFSRLRQLYFLPFSADDSHIFQPGCGGSLPRWTQSHSHGEESALKVKVFIEIAICSQAEMFFLFRISLIVHQKRKCIHK